MTKSRPPPPPYDSKERATVSRSLADPEALRATADAMLGSSSGSRSGMVVDGGDSGRAAGGTPSRLLPEQQRTGLRRLSLRGSVLSLRESLASTFMPESDAAAMSRARAHERMRAAEERAREMEQLVERLKRETYAGPTATEAELRILQLKYDSMRAGNQAGPRPSAGLFKMSCSTDLLFLLDATSSMRKYIDTAKEQIKNIVTDINRAFFNEADVRVAIVAYRDHKDKPQFETLDFTTDTDRMFAFLDGVRAVGGDDAAEDVLGALDVAMTCSWKQATRCVMHIADAPAHGRALHDMEDRYDDYLLPGSEPHNLTHTDVLARMVALKLNYVLMRINSHTDKMAFVFLQDYFRAAPDARLLKANKFFNDAKLFRANKLYVGSCTIATKTAEDVFKSLSGDTSFAKSTATGGLHFDEVELGTKYSAMRHLVVGSVTASASRTAVRLSAAASTATRSSGMSSGYTVKLGASAAPGLDAVSEDDDETELCGGGGGGGGGDDFNEKKKAAAADVTTLELETSPPQWNAAGWLDKTERFQAFSTDVVAAPGLLDRMMDSDDSIRISTTELTVLRRSRPFAEGALRVAMYARTPESTNRLVVKAFKASKAGGKSLVDMAEEMRVQALCKAFALEFSTLTVDAGSSIDFLVVTCLQPMATATGTDTATGTCLALEPLLEDGTFVKYNSNCGGVSSVGIEDETSGGPKSGTKSDSATTKTTATTKMSADSRHNAAAQAFSHFTFERSQGRFLICDLQGVGGVLTDPAVHTRDHGRFRLADTNLNEEGFKLFFATHKCNHLCEKLRLQSSAEMFITGSFSFRQDWPATVSAAAATAAASTGDDNSANAAAAASPLLDLRVCCANKLCGRIVRADKAKKTDPAYYWCSVCWPQLAATTTKVLCLAPGPHHEFQVSRFFHESQGQMRPRLCKDHSAYATFDPTLPTSPIVPQRSSRSFFGGRRY